MLIQQRRNLLDLFQVLLVVDVQLGVASQCSAIDMHGQTLDIAQVGQLYHLRFSNLVDRIVNVHLVGRIVERCLSVAQDVGALPRSPAVERLLYPTVLFGSGKAVVRHELITLDS